MKVETFADPIAQHAEAMLAHLGEEPRRPGLQRTPQRFAKAMRGVEKQHSHTATRALRGVYAHDVAARQEILAIMKDR